MKEFGKGYKTSKRVYKKWKYEEHGDPQVIAFNERLKQAIKETQEGVACICVGEIKETRTQTLSDVEKLIGKRMVEMSKVFKKMGEKKKLTKLDSQILFGIDYATGEYLNLKKAIKELGGG